MNGKLTVTRRLKTLGAMTGVGALMLAACSDDATNDSDDPVIQLVIEDTAIPAIIADRLDMWEGINVEMELVGQDQPESLLMAGQADITWMGPLDVAQLVSEGEDIIYLDTSGSMIMQSGVIIRAEDADKFQNVSDLEGHSLGHPGFGTGTWATFSVIAQEYYGIADPEQDFETVAADSGGLMALVEQGQIDAALVFSTQTVSASALPEFDVIFTFGGTMEELTGEAIIINGAVSTTEWAEEHPEELAAFIEGLDEATEWMVDNPDEFREGGQFSDIASSQGWNSSPELLETVLEQIGSGSWFVTSEAYTDEWRAATYELVEAGEGVIVDSVPAIEDIFFVR